MSLQEILKRMDESKTELSKLQHKLNLKLCAPNGKREGYIYLNDRGEMAIELNNNKYDLTIRGVKKIIEMLSIYVTEVESSIPAKPNIETF